MKTIFTEDLTVDKLNRLIETIDEMFMDLENSENET